MSKVQSNEPIPLCQGCPVDNCAFRDATGHDCDRRMVQRWLQLTPEDQDILDAQMNALKTKLTPGYRRFSVLKVGGFTIAALLLIALLLGTTPSVHAHPAPQLSTHQAVVYDIPVTLSR